MMKNLSRTTKDILTLCLIALLGVGWVSYRIYTIYRTNQESRHNAGLTVVQELGIPPTALLSERTDCRTTGCVTLMYFATPMSEPQLLAQMLKSPYWAESRPRFEDENRYAAPVIDWGEEKIRFVPGQRRLGSPRTIHYSGIFPSTTAKSYRFIKPVFFPVALVPDSYTYDGKPLQQNVIELYVSNEKD